MGLSNEKWSMFMSLTFSIISRLCQLKTVLILMRYKVFRVAWLIYGVSVNDTKMIEIMIRWHKSQASGQIQAGVMRKTLQYYVRSSAGLRSSEYYEFSFSIIMSSNLSVYRNLEWRYTWKCLKITYHIIQYCRVPSKERYGGDKNKTIRRRKKMRDMSCKPDLYRDHPVILLNIITSHLLQHDSLSLPENCKMTFQVLSEIYYSCLAPPSDSSKGRPQK